MSTAAFPASRPKGQQAATIERFAAATSSASGVFLSEMAALDELHVRTRNSLYRITVLCPEDSRILVQGGAFFPIPCEAHLSGCTLGGTLLKLNWVGCGFFLEILHEGRRIVTTRIQSIAKRPLRRAG